MIAGTIRFLIDEEDRHRATATMSRIMTAAAAIGLNCIVDWSFPAPPMEVIDPTEHQLQERHAEFIDDLIIASRRH
jgi:hypothetical protein